MGLEVWQAVVLGLVEGITEYLPISSTGHLILASSLMGLDTPERKAAVDAFNIVVQGGAILAVVTLYWPSCLRMLRGLLGKDPGGFKLLVMLVTAFVPSAVLGVLLKSTIEKHLFHAVPVLAAIVAGGVFMIVLDWRQRGRLGRTKSSLGEKTIDDLTLTDALVIGLLQCLAMWPGTSRSMMTITGGMIVGLRPKAAAEFSFLLGLPTLTAASLYTLAKDLHHAHDTGGQSFYQVLGLMPTLVGLVVAAVSAGAAVKFLVAFLSKHGLGVFGWYRLVLAAVLMALMAAGVVTLRPHGSTDPNQTQRTIQPMKWERPPTP
ncbi:MAG: undecaprenyl-diphosphatase 2 [Phycisphaerae bacterium]|nr:MAG: undecaprenyl-diphosphatase 2 [Phycisphaerae bacterium]